ncbi:hypothetical protein [Methanocalculus sp. MC3]
MSSDIPPVSEITVIPESYSSYTGKWMGGFTPSPDIPIHSDEYHQKLAAKLWVDKVMKKNPSLFDSLKEQHLWSCRDNEVVFWQAVAAIIQEKGSTSPNVEPETETIETKSDFPSDEELGKLDHPALLNLCEELAQHYPFLAGKREEFDKKGVFSSPENTRIFLMNMRNMISHDNKQTPKQDTASTLTPRTALDNVPLLVGDLTLKISSSGNNYISEIYSKGEVVVSDTASIPAFQDSRAAGRIARKIKDTLPVFDQKNVKDHLDRIFNDMGNSPDSHAIMSEACAEVLRKTVSVKREMTESPTYIIEMDDTVSLTFQTKDFGSLNSSSINNQWIEKYNRGLDIKTKEFKQIRDFWMERAEDIEPLGCVSPWEPIAEQILEQVASKTASNEQEGLVRSGLYKDLHGPLWVAGSIISDVMKDNGKSPTDPGLSHYLKKTGFLITGSTVFRIGSQTVRAWGFDPQLKPLPDNSNDDPFTDSEEVCAA